MTVRRGALLGMLAVMAGCALWGFWIEPASLRVQRVELPVAWPYARPFRVAVVSDLHVGSPYQTLEHLGVIVDRVNATHPDLVCLLGDFVTKGVIGGRRVPPRAIAEVLGRLRAADGVAAVLGNHDHPSNRPDVETALTSAGIRVLEDTAIRLSTPGGPVWIAGVSDLWSAQHDIGRALRAVTDTGTPVILITHNPDIFPEVPASVMLTLAGHTHGGQVRLPLIGAPIEPSRYGQRYAAGHIVERGRHLFVSTGIGTSSIPVRFGVPPTIFVLEITRGAVTADSGGSSPRTVARSR